jgi:ATP-dependent DNA helicase RecQ
MRTLIVGKTHMYNAACIGGLALDTNLSLRLLQPDGSNYPEDNVYEVGEIWDLTFKPRSKTIPPHTEDVLVQNRRFLGLQDHLAEFLCARIHPWQGPPAHLFDNLIQESPGGSGFIARSTGIPEHSTGFWISDRYLIRADYNQKVRYNYPHYEGVRYITYVGFGQPIERIPAGTLVRVSLARWWRPPDDPEAEEKCFLQLSGWYL